MAKLADALDLGSSGAIHGGSSPSTRTKQQTLPRPFGAIFLTSKNDYKMSVTQQQTSDLTTKINVHLKKEEYEKSVTDAIKKLAKQVAIKGFRPGMAPLGLVKKMHGNSILIEEVNKLLNDRIFNFIQTESLDLLGQPMPAADQPFLDLSIDKMHDIDFSYEIGLAPKVDFDFLKKAAPFTHYKVAIEDNMVNEEVDRLRKRFASYEYPEAVGDNDILMFTIEELDTDGNVKEGGVSTTNSIMLDMLKADKKDSFLALKKHDSITLNIFETIDREKDAVIKHVLNVQDPATVIDTIGSEFKLTLNNITRSVPAELNEEFFKKAYGEGGPTSEAEMKELIKKDLQAYFDGQADAYLTNLLHQYMMENAGLVLPDDFMKRWIKTVNEKEITQEQIEADYPQFSKQIKWNLMVKKVVTEQQLSVGKEELEQFARTQIMSQMYGYGLKDIGSDWLNEFVAKQMLDKKYVEQTRERILDDKALAYLKTQVKVEEKPTTFEDFKALVETAK